jgi:hypothetical protein
MPFINVETRGSEPFSAGGNTLTLFSQSLTIRLPFSFLHGGLIWNRPVSVLAVAPDGQEQIIPIKDPTRQAQWSLLFASLGSMLLMFAISRKLRRS